MREAAVDSTQFYRVGLACEAAPGIGCGIRSKPVLQALEGSERIAGAWLSRSGGILAVRWRSRADEDEGLISSVFTGEDCACIERITGASERRSLYESLGTAGGWCHAADIDRLSVEEAVIIAQRVVRRLAAKATLDAEGSARLVKSIARECERMLTTEAPGTAHSREERLRRAILDGGRAELEGEDYVNLEKVVAVAPHRPLPNER